MKKCVTCRSHIELIIPMTICTGGTGTISEVKNEVEVEPIKPSTSDPGAAQGPIMNNGSRDSNNDLQKLQQQLHDIKEQVGDCCIKGFMEINLFSVFRPCVRFAWIV